MLSDQPDSAAKTASVAARDLSYGDLGVRLTGRFYWDDTRAAPQPGILLIHGGTGLDEQAREQAVRYAELGYAVLAGDMFGAGVAGDRERIMACLTRMRDDPTHLVRRARAGMSALERCPETGPRLAAVGFCFGGMAALALARAGADLAGVVSVHGSLTTTRAAEPGAIRTKVLVCHGASDPYVPMDDVVAFTKEMSHADADWQLAIYGGAMHGFTHRHATPGAVPGTAYDRLADQRSFAAARTFLADTLLTRD